MIESIVKVISQKTDDFSSSEKQNDLVNATSYSRLSERGELTRKTPILWAIFLLRNIPEQVQNLTKAKKQHYVLLSL